jgi:tetratricopeptide (TPR) repeat protein
MEPAAVVDVRRVRRARPARRCTAAIVSLAVLALLGLALAPASAEPVRGRILRGLEFQSGAESLEIRIRFGVPIRYLRHVPQHAADNVQIRFTPLTQDLADTLARFGREALRPAKGAPGPLIGVTYEGDSRTGPLLEVRFARPVRFEVSQGSDFRSLVLTVPLEEATPRATSPAPPPASSRASAPGLRPPLESAPKAAPAAPIEAGRFAVQLQARPAAEPLPSLTAGGPGFGRRLYTVGFRKNGAAWRRLRLGFFASAAEAAQARDALKPQFPDAWVVEPSKAERLAAAYRPVPAETPRRTARPAVPPKASPATADASESSKLSSDEIALAERWLDEAREAMTAGDLDRAVGLLTKVLSLPENRHSPAAKELLGHARERKGQLAHARAEYEDYLAHYPDGEDAARVRQRLDALLTARAEPPEPLREARAPDGSRIDTIGSVSLSYRRDVRSTDLGGRIVSDNSAFADLFLRSQARAGPWDVSSELSGSYLAGLSDGLDDEFRTSTAFLEATGVERPVSASLGRQPGNTAGVIGRFDGGRVSLRLNPTWTLSTVAGFPTDPFVSNGIDTDRTFSGLSLDATGLLEGFDAQLFAIQQWADGTTDRLAVGGEFRYVRDALFLAGLVDADLHFGSLNTLFLVGNWQSSAATTWNLLADFRNLPTLTTAGGLPRRAGRSLLRQRDRVPGRGSHCTFEDFHSRPDPSAQRALPARGGLLVGASLRNSGLRRHRGVRRHRVADGLLHPARWHGAAHARRCRHGEPALRRRPYDRRALAAAELARAACTAPADQPDARSRAAHAERG